MSIPKHIIATLLVAILLTTSLSAKSSKELTLKEISAMPKSVEKDYYIWRFLMQKSTTAKEARAVASQIRYANSKLKKAYYKKTHRRLPVRKKRRVLSDKERAILKKKQAIAREIIRSKNPIKAWKRLTPTMQIFVFNNVGRSSRRELDHTPSKKEWIRLTKEWAINSMVRKIQKERLPHFSKALLMLPAKNNRYNYTVETNLGLYAIKHGKRGVAAALFNDAVKKARSREEADRALFWTYLSTKNKKYLSKITRSYEVNIYTLAAREILKLRYPRIIVPKLPKAKINQKLIKDPIEWAKIRRRIRREKDLKRYALKFATAQTVGIYSYILAKASRDKKQFFPMPYRDIVSKFPKKRQAIIYAIARQESQFIPSAVSSSFALGMMQLMPFLIEHISKQKGEKIDYDDIFEPKKAIEYANYHLNYLYKWLHHPLFVAYAYNAGIGYTKRMLKRGKLFTKKDDFEPWLSLEMVDKAQAREYGKKVLTNYVIYMNLLGKADTILHELSYLHHKKKTDRFRRR